MIFSWRATLRSSELWTRAGPKSLWPRYFPAGRLKTGQRHATPTSSRLLHTTMSVNGPRVASFKSDIVNLPPKDEKDSKSWYNLLVYRNSTKKANND
ncbi:uncharacterized protein N7500_004800 [Penicillium coprophilum]|uniref:uncharacterized protein n=1 Tax=Penicillium coprophilum TaxID=36646 RepID=UPI002388E3E5|nr:uncharacterized protein N7500_004800 [Penicillium coprophilum]KAJ5162970.1 hypothetical protein N7500_004800 [Penicillium coprophilum]